MASPVCRVCPAPLVLLETRVPPVLQVLLAPEVLLAPSVPLAKMVLTESLAPLDLLGPVDVLAKLALLVLLETLAPLALLAPQALALTCPPLLALARERRAPTPCSTCGLTRQPAT